MAERPNILFVLTDQQRWDALGASGNPHVSTPNLDRLASEACMFTNAFCNSPVCMPSRMSMLTGQRPGALGIACNGIDLPRNVPTLATLLGGCGYETANLGKLHFTSHSNRDHKAPHYAYDFDTLCLSDEPGCYEDAYIAWVREQDPKAVEGCRCDTPPAWVGEPIHRHPREEYTCYAFKGHDHLTHSAFVATRTIEFLRSHDKQQPFFCIAGFFAPHEPLNPPQRFIDLYDPASLPLPHMQLEETPDNFTPERWRQIKQHYYALVSHVDEEVGRILKTLDETGLRHNTMIVFTSDHGEHLGDHGLLQKGPPGFESCVHVPLLIAAPGIKPRRIDGIVELVDVAPTILEACGLSIPIEFQGTSLFGLMRGESCPGLGSALIEFHAPGTEHHWKTLRTPTHKYCLCASGVELLFDLESDPHEQLDISAVPKYDSVLQAMRSRMLRCWHSAERSSLPRTAPY